MSRSTEGAEPIKGDTIVVRWPHFKLVGDELFFLISQRPLIRLDESQVAIWESLVKEPSVDDLRCQFAGRADQEIKRFSELGICEFIATQLPAGRRRVIVLEPHSDDAALSVGGTMWLRRHECEFLLFTVGSRSNFTSYYYLEREFFNVDRVATLRNAEAALVMRLLGGQHVALGQTEGPLRYQDGNWSLDWFRQHRNSVSAFNLHRSGEQELGTWTAAIRSVLRDVSADEVWLPLGVGAHTDHELTRNACLSALLEDASCHQGRTLRLYQDVPYDAQHPAHIAAVVNGLERAGASLLREVVPIPTAFSDKLRLVSVYASQFKLAAVKAGIEASARMATGGDGLAEVFWRLDRLPTTLDMPSLYLDYELVSRTAARLNAWVWQHRDAKRIRLLLLMPAGRWAEDMTFLLSAFPRAHFDVYVAPGSAAEVAGFSSDRIQLFHVDRGGKAWMRLALRLALHRPAPTVFLAGPERLREARMMAYLWPFSPTVVLPTLDHFVLALRQALAEARLESVVDSGDLTRK